MILYSNLYKDNIYTLETEKDGLIGFIYSNTQPKGKITYKKEYKNFINTQVLSRNIYKEGYPYLDGKSISIDYSNHSIADISIGNAIQVIDGQIRVICSAQFQNTLKKLITKDSELKEGTIKKPSKTVKEEIGTIEKLTSKDEKADEVKTSYSKKKEKTKNSIFDEDIDE